ncbi:MAG: nucleotidyl transferase AbiEii/AbiGii toxin family protein [Bacteroidales bacterium]|nr:nucleotidyl transferase AbiEii/AbiGii toxin family protein [Bacteroidales bacterium]
MSELSFEYMPHQTRKVFDKLAGIKFMKDYTLVGGTALAIQIKHRKSEDLDFITDNETINPAVIKRNIANVFTDYRIIREDKHWQLDMIIDGVKVTWFSAGAVAVTFKTKDYSIPCQNTHIARPEIIAVHKLSAISQRNTLRDYYDLFFLAKYIYPLEEIIALTRKLNPALSPVTYSEMLIYTEDIPEEDMGAHLSPKENLSKQQIADFFIVELRRIKEKLI